MKIEFTPAQLALRDELRAYFEDLMTPELVRELSTQSGEGGGPEYRKALRGENNSVLISSASLINLFPGAPPVYCKLKTYIPFRGEEKFGERKGNIMGVIEVVNDLSDDMEAIIRLQGRPKFSLRQ